MIAIVLHHWAQVRALTVAAPGQPATRHPSLTNAIDDLLVKRFTSHSEPDCEKLYATYPLSIHEQAGNS